MEKTPEYIKARGKAIKYIMYKFRTEHEVRNKLLELEFNEDIIDKVIFDLIELEYINDNEYVKKFIESNKKSKKNSKSMIKLKLRDKGIDIVTIDKYFIENDFNEIDTIKNILLKKRFSSNLEYEEKNKIIAYCVRKGFCLSDVKKAIKELE